MNSRSRLRYDTPSRLLMHVSASLIALQSSACGGDPSQTESWVRQQQPDSTGSHEKSIGREDPNATRTILKRSAAVVQGVAEEMKYEYDENTGPRTVVTFKVSTVHAGRYDGDTAVLRMFGGPTPDGDFVSTSVSHDFVKGALYVLFIRNDSWFYMPLVAEALRIEHVHRREVLVGRHGFALKGLSPEGLEFGRERLVAEGRPNGMFHARALASPPADSDPSAVAGTLDVAALTALLHEAISGEGVAPSGRFNATPLQRINWRNTPVEAPSPVVAEPSK